MGGGAMVFRGMARAAAVASVNHPSTGSAICNICTAQSRPAPTSASPCLCKGHQAPPPLLHASSQSAVWDVGDWELLEDQERSQHVVFGSAPTDQEVDEASSDLQNAIRLGLVPASSSSSAYVGADERFEVSDRDSSTPDDIQSGEVPQHVAIPWVEPPTVYSNRRRVRAGGISAVTEALQLFQHNPGVQGIVRSLATDKAVWDAVWRNEEVQEFRRRLQESKVPASESGSEHDGSAASANLSLYTRFVERTKKAFSQFLEGLIDILNGVFEFADSKVLAEKDGDPFERTIKSCMVLAVMVLMIVSVKRSSI